VECTENGRAVGRLNFFRETRFGICSSNMPAFTHFLGPAIDPGEGNPQNLHWKTLSITAELIEKLPKLSSFRQKMHRGITDVVEFQSARFSSMVQFTYEIAPSGPDLLWQSMRKKTRNAVRNGRKHYEIGTELEPAEFISLARKNVARRGMAENVNLGLALKLLEGCIVRGCGKFFTARNAAGAVEAAIFVIWDQASCYLLMATRAPESSYGALAGLIWEAIKFASMHGLVFDFDGIAGPGAARFFAGFGGVVCPRYIVSRASLTYRVLRETRRRMTDAYNPFC
jgi:Acetyltransferase (GNAT) domain